MKYDVRLPPSRLPQLMVSSVLTKLERWNTSQGERLSWQKSSLLQERIVAHVLKGLSDSMCRSKGAGIQPSCSVSNPLCVVWKPCLGRHTLSLAHLFTILMKIWTYASDLKDTLSRNPTATHPPTHALLNAGSHRLVLVDFSAPWCGPCRAMEPVLETWATQYAPEVWFLKVDCETTPLNRALAASKGVRCQTRTLTCSYSACT